MCVWECVCVLLCVSMWRWQHCKGYYCCNERDIFRPSLLKRLQPRPLQSTVDLSRRNATTRKSPPVMMRTRSLLLLVDEKLPVSRLQLLTSSRSYEKFPIKRHEHFQEMIQPVSWVTFYDASPPLPVPSCYRTCASSRVSKFGQELKLGARSDGGISSFNCLVRYVFCV